MYYTYSNYQVKQSSTDKTINYEWIPTSTVNVLFLDMVWTSQMMVNIALVDSTDSHFNVAYTDYSMESGSLHKEFVTPNAFTRVSISIQVDNSGSVSYSAGSATVTRVEEPGDIIIGQSVSPQLPNVKGKFGNFMYSGTANTTAPFSYTAASTSKSGGTTAKNCGYVDMDLSSSNSIYTDDGLVLPASLRTLHCIKY